MSIIIHSIRNSFFLIFIFFEDTWSR